MPTATSTATVRDLDVSDAVSAPRCSGCTRRVLDLGYGRLCMHRGPAVVLALRAAPRRSGGGRFSELTTGLDHLGFAAADRDELVEWEARLREAGVEYTPIRDMPLGYHLNFRDPDGIALELQAPTEAYAAMLADVATREVSDEEVAQLARRMLGDELPQS